MRKRRPIEVFSISFLDLLSGALGAVIILYVAIPKSKPVTAENQDQILNEFIQKDLKNVKEENENLKRELAILNQQLLEKKAIPKPPEVAKSFDVGFKFKGKEVVFLIDTSFSMYDEDRMGQVKAGVKMLITALSPDFKIEIVQYPLGERAPFKSMWGDLKKLTSFNKMDAIDYIYKLKPLGGTPIRDVLLFALRNYTNATDIVLLTDGIPTLHNSNKRDDIFDILRVVKDQNDNKIQINCIGVGSGFSQDKTHDRYKFLNLLSQQHNGFFVGF